MNPAEAYIPIDRRYAMSNGVVLPTQSNGAVLFVDISGFTPLTNALRQRYGVRRGAEELTRHLNTVYTALIHEVELYRGSVIGFSGDAITCWFMDADLVNFNSCQASNDTFVPAVLRAIAAALAIQQTMQQFQNLRLPPMPHKQTGNASPTLKLAVKTAITIGTVRRFAVGDPAIQQIDVIAGTTLDRMAATEQMAEEGELLMDAQSLHPIAEAVSIQEWRIDTAGQRYAVIEKLHADVSAQPWPSMLPLPAELARQWILPGIAERLQGDQGRFLAELRPACALFLKFTGIDYEHDEQAGQQLDSYIRWVQSTIEQREGALIQLTTGDKGSYLYAAFGAPIAHDDDIERTVTTALYLRSSPSVHPFIQSVQIGISFGTMRVGAYGSPTCRTYGVLGNETNMAARFMTTAQPGQIVTSQQIADLIRGRYQLKSLGEFQLKGRTEPQPLYAILGNAVGYRLADKLYATPLIGRDEELAQLETSMATLQHGQGGIVRIEGSAGMGKSHLVAAAIRQMESQGIHVMRGSGQSTAQDVAYFAVRQAMRELLQLNSDATPTSERRIDLLTSILTKRNPNWELRIPLLGDLLGWEIPDNTTTAAFDARLRQEALVTLTVEIFQHYAANKQLALVLEDIHWLDEASQGIVLALARVVANSPLLLVAVHRPPIQENEAFLREVATLPEQTSILLEELTPGGIHALVAERLGGPIRSLATSFIQIQAQGNPFFTEELVDAMRESGQLTTIDGSWALADSLVQQLRNAGCLTGHIGEETVNPHAPLAEIDIGIPTTIQGIILSRLDRLSEPAKLTVKVASVIGRLFAHDLLIQAHPLNINNEALQRDLETLLARDFAHLETPTPRLSYIFKHNITQEVVYQTLLTDQRHELHLSVATALEAVEPEGVEALALHYYNSNRGEAAVREKALHYLEQAGLRAKRDYANETALSYFDRALGMEERAAWLTAKVEVLHILGRRQEENEALAQLTEITDADAGEVALLKGAYYEAISDYDAAQKYVEMALTQYRNQGKQRGEIRSLNQLGVILARQAVYDAAQSYYQEALALAKSDEQWQGERAPLLYGLGIVDRQQGNYNKAKTQLEAALALHRDTSNYQGEARMLTALGGNAFLQRDYRTAEDYFQQALSIQQMIGDRTGEGSSLVSIGQVASTLGDFSQSDRILNQALQIFQAIHNRWWESIVQNTLGITGLLTGRYLAARHYFEQSLSISKEIDDATGEAVALLNLGQVLREQHKLREAESILQQSLTLTRQQGNKNFEAQSWSDLAICACYMQNWSQGIQNARNALGLFKELAIESAYTTEFCTLAEAYLHLRDPIQAEDYGTQAFNLLNELGGEGPDYPQRDYLICYRVFQELERFDKAEAAIKRAYSILQQKASVISDPAMRSSFLENVAFNREIVQVAMHYGQDESEI